MSYTPPSGHNVDLIFGGYYAPPVSSAVVLNFEITDSSLITTLDAVTGAISIIMSYPASFTCSIGDLSGAIPLIMSYPATLAATCDFTLAANAQQGTQGSLAILLDDATGAFEADWQAGVYRGIETSKSGADSAGWQCHRQLSGRFIQGQKQPLTVSSPINAGDLRYQDQRLQWFAVPHKHLPTALAWEPGEPLAQQRSNVYSASPRKHCQRINVHDTAEPLHTQREFGYTAPLAQPKAWTFNYGAGVARIQAWRSGYGLGTDRNRVEVVPWNQGTPHSWLWGGWHYPPYIYPRHYHPDPNPVFRCIKPDWINGDHADLTFGVDGVCHWTFMPTTVVIDGAAIVQHVIIVKRVSDNVEIPVISISLKFDKDSWAWGVSLVLKTQANIALVAAVDGAPCEVRIELDGFYFNALIEEWGESRLFGERSYTATGRSSLALFATPYAPLQSYLEVEDKIAAQLIDAQLLNTGWEATYHASVVQLFTTDWLVPGGAWSYQNKAPIDCIVQIARAVGARAYSDRNAKRVRIDPRYPVNPWDWEAEIVDRTIPVNLVRSMTTQLTPQPAYNHVIVSGASHGVTVSATLSGSDGALSAPMITDNLITSEPAGRERARSVLCNTGKQARVTLDLPLNSVTGLLEPGQLVEVSDTVPWRGLVTGVTVAATLGVISQSVEIERHYP